MKKTSVLGELNPVSIRRYYNLMRNSFESAAQGGACNMNRSEIDACYEWRIANMLIKNTLKLGSSFSFEEWDSFVHSCKRGMGLSSNSVKTVNNGISRIYSNIMDETDNLWRSDEERRRLNEALARLNRFLSVEAYSSAPIARSD